MPTSNQDVAPVAPAEPAPGATHETKDVHRKWVARTAEELAKADETWKVGELADALNEATTLSGVKTIEGYVELANQPRDPDAQKMVEEYLPGRLNKKLKHREGITDQGIKEMRETLDKGLTPDPPPVPEKKSFLDRLLE